MSALDKFGSGDHKDPPPPFELLSIDQLDEEMPPTIIKGLLRKFEIILIGGHSKSWKSWALLDLLYCVANGFPWLGCEVNQGKVVHFDLELIGADIRYRFEAIQKSHGRGSFDNLNIVPLRGKPFGLQNLFTLPDFLGDDVSMFSLDPTYRLLAGQNESDPGVVIDVMNRFLALGTSLKAAVGLLQHFSKGDQSQKAAIDRFSGSGVWARHPDALVTFTEHEEVDCFGVEFTLRSFAPRDPIVVRWNYPRFQIDAALDPEKLKSARTGRPKLNTAEQLAGLMSANESLVYSDFQRRAETVCQIKPRTFDRRLKEAKNQKIIYLSPLTNEYSLTSDYLEKHKNGDTQLPKVLP